MNQIQSNLLSKQWNRGVLSEWERSKQLEKAQETLSDVASLSLAMIFFFGFSQMTGFVARIVFKMTLPPQDYGVFAFFTNTFPFFATLNAFSLHVPVISSISARPSDDGLYHGLLTQLSSTSIITGIALAVLYFSWSFLVTSECLLAAYFAIMIVVYSVSQVLHCFPRGRDRLRPAAVSMVLVGTGRITLLVPFILGMGSDLLAAVVIYTVPLLGWWLAFLSYEGFSSPSRPRRSDVLPLYKDASFSSLYLVARSLPTVLTIMVLTVSYGFGTVGDFDIALIPYSGLAVAFSGISFVAIGKARKLPGFRDIMKRITSRTIVPLSVLCASVAVLAILLEDPGKALASSFGLPASAYWTAVILVVFGVPAATVLDALVSYFQGRGVIRPVGIIAICCMLGWIPVQYLLIVIYSIEGAALGLIFFSLLVVAVLIVFGYRSSQTSEYSPDDVVPLR